MRVLILGGDGYLGWPTAMYFSKRGHDVAVLDSYIKRQWEDSIGVKPLLPVSFMDSRIRAWDSATGRKIGSYFVDLTNYIDTHRVFEDFHPEAIIHYAEQPSAPFSMMNRKRAVETQVNNLTGTLNVLYAIRKCCPDAHLIKLGTMGEYGTPDCDIPEGYVDKECIGGGCKPYIDEPCECPMAGLPFPKQPGSIYHLSKVHDSNNIMFACKTWGMKATDLNQGVVYGIETDEMDGNPELRTSFHYDSIFGTAINRFCVQALSGVPITVYGKGNQKRGFLNINDTLQCVELAALNSPKPGKMRVFNQFTEVFTINELAEMVCECLSWSPVIEHVDNPRTENEEHYYNPTLQNLPQLGLKPRKLKDELDKMIQLLSRYNRDIDESTIQPNVKWK